MLPEDGPLRHETCRSDIVLINWCFSNICVHSSVFIEIVILVHKFEQDKFYITHVDKRSFNFILFIVFKHEQR